jgi:multidrug efflux pump subunit AcrA (membrane-fusion protein)
LQLPIGGKVVELPVRPGESVESGQPLLREARFDRLLVRIALPAGAEIDESVSTARIAVSGHEDRWLPAERVSLAATADGHTGGPTYLFAIKADGLSLQPGLPVTAYLVMPGEPVSGVALPRSAVIRYMGQTWVYVQTDAEQFTRREVVAGVPRQNDWFVAAGLKSGERVVTVGAQSLLSEELRSQTTGTEEEEE